MRTGKMQKGDSGTRASHRCANHFAIVSAVLVPQQQRMADRVHLAADKWAARAPARSEAVNSHGHT